MLSRDEWLDLFEQAFTKIETRLSQVLQLNDCREHWIQAELSLHAWFEQEREIWVGKTIGNGQRLDLYTEDLEMAAEVKCLGDVSYTKCIAGRNNLPETMELLRPVPEGRLSFHDPLPQATTSNPIGWSILSDTLRLKSLTDFQHKFFILIIAHGETVTENGNILRALKITPYERTIELDSAIIRIWALA